MFDSVFDSVASLLYPSARDSVALRLVECPSMCPQIVEDLKKISVFAEQHGMLVTPYMQIQSASDLYKQYVHNVGYICIAFTKLYIPFKSTYLLHFVFQF